MLPKQQLWKGTLKSFKPFWNTLWINCKVERREAEAFMRKFITGSPCLWVSARNSLLIDSACPPHILWAVGSPELTCFFWKADNLPCRSASLLSVCGAVLVFSLAYKASLAPEATESVMWGDLERQEGGSWEQESYESGSECQDVSAYPYFDPPWGEGVHVQRWTLYQVGWCEYRGF